MPPLNLRLVVANIMLKDDVTRENIKNLRGTNKLVIPKVNTTRYGTKSVAFTAPKAWNSLPDKLRSMKSLKDFKIAVRSM